MFFWRVYEFSFDFGWISGKKDEISKFGQFRDPKQQRKSMPRHGMSTLRRGREGGLDKPRVCLCIAKLRHDEGLRRSVAIVHRHVFLLCFAIPLF